MTTLNLDSYAVANRAKTQPLFQLAKTQRVAMVGIGNSNQVKDGTGWDHGLARALGLQYDLWGTGVLPGGGDNAGASPSFGYLASTNGGASAQNAQFTGAPSTLANYSTSGQWFHLYTYVPPATTYTGSFYVNKLLVDPAHPMDITGPILFRTTFGTFPSSFGVGANIQLGINNRNAGDITGPVLNTTTASYGLLDASISIGTGAMYPGGYSLDFIHSPQGSPDITGPFFQQYVQGENTSKTSGFTYQTMIFAGGQSNRAFLASLTTLGATARREYLRQVSLGLGPDKAIAFSLNDALNARNETLASIPNGYTPGDSAAAEADNWQGIIDMLKADWFAVTGSTKCYFILFSAHPTSGSTPDDAELQAYRDGGRTLSDLNPNMTFVDLTRLISYASMSGYYLAGPDVSHLNQAGYEWIGELIVNELYPSGTSIPLFPLVATEPMNGTPSVSSASAGTSTSSASAVELLPAGNKRSVSITNEGSAGGEYSIDNQTTWHRLPAGSIVTLNGVSTAEPVYLRRVGSTNVSGVYASASSY